MWETCVMMNSFYETFLPYKPGYEFNGKIQRMTWTPTRKSHWLSSFPILLLLIAHVIGLVGFWKDCFEIPAYLAFSHFCNLIMAGSCLSINRTAHMYGNDMFLAFYNRLMLYDRKMFYKKPVKKAAQKTLCRLVVSGKFIKLTHSPINQYGTYCYNKIIIHVQSTGSYKIRMILRTLWA